MYCRPEALLQGPYTCSLKATLDSLLIFTLPSLLVPSLFLDSLACPEVWYLFLFLSFSDPPPGISHTCNLSASWYHPESSSPPIQHPHGPILVTQTENAGHFAICCFPGTDAQAPPALGIRVHVASRTAFCLLLDFGDNCGAQMRLYTATGAATVTGYHQYRTGMMQ